MTEINNRQQTVQFTRFNCMVTDSSKPSKVKLIFNKELSIDIPREEFKMLNDSDLYTNAVKSKNSLEENYYISDKFYNLLGPEIQSQLIKYKY